VLKKSISYTDFDGEEQVEDFYFNLTKAECLDLEMDHYNEGGLKEAMERIVAANDGKAIMSEMKKIVLMSYGVKSPDGKRFVKNQDLRDQFESSEAYSVLFMELVTQADAAVKFIAGVMPQDMINQEQIELDLKGPEKRFADGVEIRRDSPIGLTPAQARDMDHDELSSGLATGKYKLLPETATQSS
jgi:hypothetical protein